MKVKEFGIQKWRGHKESANVYISFDNFGIALFFPPRIKFFNRKDCTVWAIKFIFIWVWISKPPK